MLQSHTRIRLSIVALVVLLGVLGSSTQAGEFVSFHGQFKVTYPDNWSQVDYTTADHHISQAGGDLNYEVVLTCDDDPGVFDGRYLIITADSVGPLSADQRDSVLQGLAENIDVSVTTTEASSFLVGDLDRNISYAEEIPAAAVLTWIGQGTSTERRNILAARFYESGVAYFYLYSPDSTLAAAQDDLRDIMASFATEGLKSRAAETIKVADVEVADEDDDDNSTPIAAFIGAFTAIFVAIIVTRRRRRAKK